MKYVKTEDENGHQEIFIFPKTVNHDDLAEILSYIKVWQGNEWDRLFKKPISAGFVDRDWNCYGRSETLNLDSCPVEDTALLAKQMA